MENLTPDVSEKSLNFEDFGLLPVILDGVKAAGFTTASPIQVEAIPVILKGCDVIGQAQTGTGKTAAFALPALSRLKNNRTVEILVLTPTRELAVQVSDEISRLGKFAGIKSVPVVGGQDLYRQVELVNRGAHVVVATPGRLMDHLRSNRFKNFAPHIVILDEADEMLDMGFVDEIRDLLRQLPPERQTLLFSATMPPAIKALADEFMKKPVHIKLNSIQQTNVDIEQRLHVVRVDEKEHALLRIIDVEDPAKAIIFCRTKRDVDDITEKLMARGIAVRAIHGDMSQPQRNQTVDLLKRGQIRIVIATDVAARGLDIRGVTHVINYHVPDNRERYIHRIGRTGRAGETGIAITLATPGDVRNHECFDKKNAVDFKVSSVPNKSAALSRRGRAMAETISATDVCQDWLEASAELLGSMPPEELVARMFSLLMGKRRVLGEDRIGASEDQARKMLAREGSSRGGFSGGGGRPSFGRKPPYRSDSRSGGGFPPRRDGGGDRGPRTGGYSSSSDRPRSDRPSYSNNDRPRGGDMPYSDRPRTERPFSSNDRPRSDRPFTKRPPREAAAQN